MLFELRLEKEIGDLKAAGVDFNAVPAALLGALVCAVKRVVAPYSAVNAELAGMPVAVCRSVWIWPMTVGAQVWLDEYAAKFFKSGSFFDEWAQVYALIHSREEKAFTPLTTPAKAKRAILATALRLCCSGKELEYAIKAAHGISEGEAPRKVKSIQERIKAEAQTRFASVVARLEVQSGIKRETWLWERSLMYTFDAYARLYEFAAAFSSAGGSMSQMQDELDAALEELARAKAAIKSTAAGK